MFVSQGSKKGIWHELQADKPVATYKKYHSFECGICTS